MHFFLRAPLIRRYSDKSSAKHNLDDFLNNAHKKQIRELNGTTGRFNEPKYKSNGPIRASDTV